METENTNINGMNRARKEAEETLVSSNGIRENGSAMKGFAEEFFKFGTEFIARNAELKLSPEELVTLYAIYKKQMRTERMNGNGYNSYGNKPKQDERATEKQKNAIQALMRKGRIVTNPEFNLDALTKRKASEMISEALG